MDVLIVEDEEALLESLLEGLAPVFPDLEIRGCGSAEDAEALIRNEVPRLVVSDVRLPAKDGVQLLIGVRELHPKVAFVFMSAYPSPEAQGQARQSGIRFLSKPFEFQELVDAIEEGLGEDHFSGEVGGISLVDLLQVLNMGRRTAAVTLERRGEIGRIHLRDGEVVHAEVGDLKGRAAFDHLMAWRGGSFGSEPGCEPPADTIAEPFNSLLLDSFRLLDEAGDLEQGLDQAFGDEFLDGDGAGRGSLAAEGGKDRSDLHGIGLDTLPGCLLCGSVDLPAAAWIGVARGDSVADGVLDLMPAGASRLLEQAAIEELDRALAPPATGEAAGRVSVQETIVLSSDLIYVFQRADGDPDHAHVSISEAASGFGTVVAKARRWKRLAG